MTAREAGEIAAEGIWVTLKRLRDQWLLLVFAASALFWARDTYERFADLPVRVAELSRTVGELSVAFAEAGPGGGSVATVRSPALMFPGERHAIGDGRPGEFVTASFRPVRRVRPECRNSDLAAFMIDADGRWYSVSTDLVHVPKIEGSQELAFGVRVHPRMAEGRARFLLQLTQDCGSHRQVDDSPRLHFRVLPR